MNDDEIRAAWSSLIDSPHITLRILRDDERAEMQFIADASVIAGQSSIRASQTTPAEDESILAALKILVQDVRTSLEGATQFLVRPPWAGTIPEWASKPPKARYKKWA